MELHLKKFKIKSRICRFCHVETKEEDLINKNEFVICPNCGTTMGREFYRKPKSLREIKMEFDLDKLNEQ